MKEWVLKNSWIIFAIGLGLYLIGETFLAFSFKWENIAIASLMMVLFNIMALGLVSWFYFGEKFNALQILGLAPGLASIILLEIAHR